MKSKKAVILGIIAICIAIVAITIAFVNNWSTNNDKSNTQTNANIIGNQLKNETKNEILNEAVNEVANEGKNEISEPQDNKIENTSDTSNTTSEVLDEEPATAEEKAIQVVTKDWKENHGEDLTGIKISVEGMDSNGRYVVAIRNIETTQAMAFYNVLTSDGTFTKKEMQN